MAQPLLESRDLTKRFRARGGETTILRDVSLCVHRGETVVITGRSGSGKSTLLGLLAGLDPPTAGSVAFEGRDFASLSAADLARLRRERIGVIFQSYNLLPAWTAFENVEAGLLRTEPDREARRVRVEAALRDVGLADRMAGLPSELSVGQQQRVAVARTLAMGPDLILADEPVGEVDPETGREILALLLAHVSEDGRALVLATHGAPPEGLGGKAYRLEEGRLLAEGAPRAELDSLSPGP